VALRTILPRRAEIGAYISTVVDNWDTPTLVNRLELQVGKDLQYIRINGTLVGGLVGLLIFTLSRALADENRPHLSWRALERHRPAKDGSCTRFLSHCLAATRSRYSHFN
jgi:hypothetical protein